MQFIFQRYERVFRPIRSFWLVFPLDLTYVPLWSSSSWATCANLTIILVAQYNYKKAKTRSSATADGPRDALCHLKPCHMTMTTLGKTCYILPVYKIWQLSLHPFRRYDCGRRNWKWVDHGPWPRPFRGCLSSLR